MCFLRVLVIIEGLLIETEQKNIFRKGNTTQFVVVIGEKGEGGGSGAVLPKPSSFPLALRSWP